MPTLPKTEKKNISGNAVRQARYAEKMRSQGRKKLTVWVTPEEERKIKGLLKRCDEKREAVR
ncbi:MAG: hypothetical protein ACYCXP_08435 [Leptospirillum sp.]|nr:hypothetical protein [Nitrospiraceae bacterium]